MKSILFRRFKLMSYVHKSEFRGYRFVYIDYERGENVYCLFGLHWIARLVYRTWLWTFNWNPKGFEKQLLDAWMSGYQARTHDDIAPKMKYVPSPPYVN